MERVGGCLCRKVRFECFNEPAFQFVCHCEDCRKQHSSIFGSYVSYAEDDFSLLQKNADSLVGYQTIGNSGKTKQRYFCGSCGSFIYFTIPQLPGICTIGVGLFDSPEFFRPNMQLYCKDKVDNRDLDLVVDSFETYPEEVSNLVHSEKN